MIFYLVGVSILISLVVMFCLNRFVTYGFWFLHGVLTLFVAFFINYMMASKSVLDSEIVNGSVIEKNKIEVLRDEGVCVYNPKMPCKKHTVLEYTVFSEKGAVVINEPQRYETVKEGEPFAFKKSYKNFNQLNDYSDSILNSQNQYINKVPDYPKIFDYYKVNRVIFIGGYKNNFINLNQKLSENLILWGGQYNLNVIIFLLNEDYSKEYVDAIKLKWNEGKKNDVILAIQLNKYDVINWVSVISKNQSEGFKQYLGNKIKEQYKLNNDNLISTLDKVFKNKYEKPKEEYYNSSVGIFQIFYPSKEKIVEGISYLITISIFLLIICIYDTYEKRKKS